MATETMSTAAPAERNRTVARRWIDAFNARDTEAEARARTPGHVAHAPESIQPAPLDGDAWTGFLASMVARRIDPLALGADHPRRGLREPMPRLQLDGPARRARGPRARGLLRARR